MKCASSNGTLSSNVACFVGASGVPHRILRHSVYTGIDVPTPGDHLCKSCVLKLTTFTAWSPGSSFFDDVGVRAGKHTEDIVDELAIDVDEGTCTCGLAATIVRLSIFLAHVTETCLLACAPARCWKSTCPSAGGSGGGNGTKGDTNTAGGVVGACA